MVLKGQKHVRPTSHLQKIAKENISALKNGQKKWSAAALPIVNLKSNTMKNTLQR